MKKYIIGFILGIIVTSSISVIAYSIASKDISYDNSISGTDKTNVQDAIDELYELGGKTKIVYIGEYVSDQARTIDIKELLPNNYSKLTIDNFILIDMKDSFTYYNTMQPPDNTDYIFNSYDSTTGILSLNPSRYRLSTYDFHATYKLGVILGKVEISNIN